MLFVMIGEWEAEDNQEVTKRRMQFKYPEEVKVIGEYVLIGRYQVVGIYEVPNEATLMKGTIPFDGVMTFRFYPAMAYEDVMKIVAEATK